ISGMVTLLFDLGNPAILRRPRVPPALEYIPGGFRGLCTRDGEVRQRDPGRGVGREVQPSLGDPDAVPAGDTKAPAGGDGGGLAGLSTPSRSEPGSSGVARRRARAARYSESVDAGSSSWPATDRRAASGANGSHGSAASVKPKPGGVAVHGSGVRHPSLPSS